MNEDIEERAMNLLRTMDYLGKSAVNGDPAAKPFIDADAIRVTDGIPSFHKDRFLAVLADMMFRQDA